jgi:hypothetical protein
VNKIISNIVRTSAAVTGLVALASVVGAGVKWL